METGNPESLLTPSEMVSRTGASLDTLRYYEREGLITDVARAENGHRRYDADDVEWIEVLRCLRLTGMSIQDMKAFALLVQSGDKTQPERYAQLLDHRQHVLETIDGLRDAMVVLDKKTKTYERILKEKGLL